MTALAQNYNQPLYERALQVKHTVIGASVTLYAGTLCMNDAGVAKVMTAAGLAGGAKLLGFPTSTYTNSTASNVTLPPAEIMMFRRDCPMEVSAKSGDEPTIANVGGNVYLKDNFTVGATDAGTDLAVVLLEVLSASKMLIALP
jgi:hypothetical protein